MSDSDSEVVSNITGVDVSHPLEALASVAIQYGTAGLVGFKDGKLGEGATIRAGRLGLHAIDEGVGEVTGRNLQRKAQMEAKDAATAARQEQANELKNEQARKFREDVDASTKVASVRTQADMKNKSIMGSSLGPEKDFLGL